MKTKEIKKAIEKLGPWHQRYSMRGLYTTDKIIAGEEFWPDIRVLMGDDLDGMRIMDLGANAGYYSVMSALEGAEVHLVEPDPKYFKQAKWTKYYFEQEKGIDNLNIKFYKKTASELDFDSLGNFDCILAISSLYFIGSEFDNHYSEQERIISELCKKTDKIIVKTVNDKPYNSLGYYNKVFLDNNFFMLKRIMQKYERPVMLYGPLVKETDYGL